MLASDVLGMILLLHPAVEIISIIPVLVVAEPTYVFPTFLDLLSPLVPNLTSFDHAGRHRTDPQAALSRFILALPRLQAYRDCAFTFPVALVALQAAPRLKTLKLLRGFRFGDVSPPTLGPESFPRLEVLTLQSVTILHATWFISSVSSPAFHTVALQIGGPSFDLKP
jgi:hypothetical protein